MARMKFNSKKCLMKKCILLSITIGFCFFSSFVLAESSLDTIISTPTNLIRENVKHYPNYITLQYERYGVLTGLPSGMKRIETTLDNNVGINDPQKSLLANSLLVVGTWYSVNKKNYTVKTYIEITQRSDVCLIPTKDELTIKKGSIVYGISSYQGVYNDLGKLITTGSQYSSTQICANKQNKIKLRFANMIYNFFLPITIETYDEKGGLLPVSKEVFIPIKADTDTFKG